MKRLSFQIDMSNGRFCIKDADGFILRDQDLKFILDVQKTLWLRQKRLDGFEISQAVT